MNICITKHAANITCLLLVSLLLGSFVNWGCKPKKASKCPSYEADSNSTGRRRHKKNSNNLYEKRKRGSQKSPFWSITYHPGIWH